MMYSTISDALLDWYASLDGDNRDMDERRKFDEMMGSREIWDVYMLTLKLTYNLTQ